MKKLIASILLFASTLSWATDDVSVTTTGFNRLVFGEPFEQIMFPPGQSFPSDPLILNDNHVFIFELDDETVDVIDVIVMLKSGESLDLRMIPKADIGNQVWRQSGASDSGEKAGMIIGRPSDEWMVNLMRQLAVSEVPKGFSLVDRAMRTMLIGPVRARPISVWSGAGYELKSYQLTSSALVNIEPQDFYREGVAFVFPTNDVVSPEHSPFLYILEGAK